MVSTHQGGTYYEEGRDKSNGTNEVWNNKELSNQ